MTDTIDCNVTRRGVLAGGAASAALTSIPASAQTPAPSAGAAPAAMPVRMTVNGKPQALNLDPRTTLLDALREREALGSTGFGRAVAIPHARLETIDRPLAMLIHLDRDVDFDAADGIPVRLVVGLLSPSDAGAQHLHALAAISRVTRDERVLHQLFEARSEEELFAIIANSGLRDAA